MVDACPPGPPPPTTPTEGSLTCRNFMGGRAELSRLSLFRYSLTYTKKGRAKAVKGTEMADMRLRVGGGQGAGAG